MENNQIFSDFYLPKKHKVLHCFAPQQAFIQYRDFRINLLSGEKSKISIKEFMGELESFKISDDYLTPKVLHLFYELGYFCTELEELIPKSRPLAIYIDYEQAHEEALIKEESSKIKYELLEHLPKSKYFEKFNQVYKHLLEGDCYQLNLTMPFYLKLLESLSYRELRQKLWSDPMKVGAYAHGSYIGPMDKIFFSNSPECLFQASQNKIRTMPIKGTKKVAKDGRWHENWQELIRSKKDESELYMITDLMRNDLTKIELHPAKVIYKKYPLKVPGLIHQFSIIESDLSKKVTLADVIASLFPGGSITGAPKKRVMQLSLEIENYHRGFYCGSTVLMYKKMKTASINIRSLEIDLSSQEAKYGAGGGITLLSKKSSEYKEALEKLKSFLSLLN